MARRKNTDEDEDDIIGDIPESNSGSVTTAELRAFIERWEALQVDKEEIAKEQRDVMAEAKGRGYDTKVLRAIIAERKKDPESVEEFQSVLELYKSALGM